MLLSCYKFADDGTLMISHESMLECHRLMQLVCDYLSIWCIKNKIALNYQINKTEAMILKTTNESTTHRIPELRINGISIKYVRSTQVLGIILDEKLSFKDHAHKKLNECKKKWGLITKNTNRNHGLNVRSLTILLKGVILTKLLYGAPLWLANNLDCFTGFWNQIIMKISGAMLNPHRELTEIALHLPPLELQLEMLTVKFLCKCITSEDFMSSVLLQAESSLQKHLPDQLSAIKNFLAWKKDPSRPRGRQVDLLEPSTQLLSHYNKLEIKQYEMFLWAERNKNRAFLRKHSSDADETVMELMKKMQQTNVLLNKNSFLFNHNTSKEEDSFILDYIHGNSLIFGNNRNRHLGEENVCSFCNETQDGRVHQLSECKEVQDETHQAYTNTPYA